MAEEGVFTQPWDRTLNTLIKYTNSSIHVPNVNVLFHRMLFAFSICNKRNVDGTANLYNLKILKES
ncbi:hypothetical protein DX541_09785 [Vibrio fluvialis]|nr:hypothetical protein [Vibrio fluvialis]